MDDGIAIHFVDTQEILARIRKQLPVSRMINGFYAQNFLRHFGIMLFHMAQPFQFCRTGADNQNLGGIGNRFSDSMQIRLVRTRVSGA